MQHNKDVPMLMVGFFTWVILLFAVVFFGISLLNYQPTFPYSRELLIQYENRMITTWAQFDGVHYLTIIRSGYEGTGLIQAFFPLYPLLVKLLSFDVFNPIIVGMIVSVLSLAGSLFFLYRLILLDESVEIAKKSLVLLLLFPAAFFLVALYTESLFLLLVVTSFYAARRNQWVLAFFLGLFAGTTRLVGVFLFPALLYEFWGQHKKNTITVLWCLGPLIGLLIYMSYLWTNFGDPLLFYHVQAGFGASRTNSELVLLPRVIFRYIKMLASTPIQNPIYPILVEELIAGCLGIVGLITAWFKTRKSYVIFAMGAFLLPTLTGTFSSMPRYLLPLFPLFIWIAKFLPRKYFLLIIFTETIVLIYNLIRFTQGMWVA